MSKKSTAIIFGASGSGRMVYQMLKEQYTMVGFSDNNSEQWGQTLFDLPIYSPSELSKLDFDCIILGSFVGYYDIQEQLEGLGIPRNKMVSGPVGLMIDARILFLKYTAQEIYRKKIPGCVAEAGVFRGDFAKEINRFFPDRKCFLFDTFEGFAQQDLAFEQKESVVGAQAKHMADTQVQVVYHKMPNPDVVEIRKGYFPQTAQGIEEQFCFVNLDMDLYKPTYEGLVFFYPKLVQGGTLLIHDYFSDSYPNVRQAVEDYQKDYSVKLTTTPIGDGWSIAILKG